MGEQLPLVGAGAALTVLLAVIGIFARTNASDRRSYWQRTADLLSQWKKADEAWQVRLNALEAAHARCQKMVDDERKRRWDVEDELARLRRAVTGQLDEPH